MRNKRSVITGTDPQDTRTLTAMSNPMNADHCWQAVKARDASKDGQFYYGVLTTGVYCRPSCASRQPLRKNLRYFDSPAAAEAAGFRPCKRCRPNIPDAGISVAKMQALCRYIEQHADQALTLETLGKRVHLSPFHLQRRFKDATGVTPKQFIDACRLRKLRQDLRDGAAVTRAIQDAGYGSASRVYERAVTRLGMTPKQYRAGGAGIAISYASAPTELGLLMMGATDRGLCFVQFGDSEAALLARLRAEYPSAELAAMDDAMRPPFKHWMATLAEHLKGKAPSRALPLDLRGTAFQLRVWQHLQQIPSGELRSYSELAAAIGQPRAVRAVASACAANRVALLVPCHRVIRGDGSLGGYKWGLERKRILIDQERARHTPQP